MADRIKGITVEIGGETTGLKKALQGVNKEISNTQSQLKDVDRLLKLDPSNTTLLEQRQRLLSEAVDETSTKLEALKDAERQVQQQFQRGEVSREQYEALQREIIETEQRLDSLREAASRSNVTMQQVGQAALNVSDGATKVADATKPLTTAVLGLGAAVVATVPATEEYRTAQGKLASAFESAGFSAQAAQESYETFYKILGDTDTATEASQLLAQLAEREEDVAKWGNIAAGVAGTFGDALPVESLIESANETARVGQVTGTLADALNWAGKVGEDEFNAMLADCSTESERNQLIMETLADTYSGAADAFWENNAALVENREASSELQAQMAQLASSIQPVITSVTKLAAQFLEWFNGLSSGQQTAIAAILAIIAAISPVATVIGTVSSAIAIFTGAATTGTAAATGLASIMGGKYGRVLFLKEYASYIKDSMINELTGLNRNLMLSIDIIPVPTDEAVRELQNRLLGVETNVTNWQRRQNSNNNFSAIVPYDLEQQRKETREMLDDLTTRDQRMLFAVVTLVHLADSKKELDSDTEALQSIVRKHLCQLAPLSWQQADGLVTALPLGLRRISALRTLTTEALAVLMPFKAQEIRHQGGVYYGQNVISRNLILANRKELLNGNGFVLGVSGSGKSFTAKRELAALALATNDDIICIDPESEYRPIIEGLGGEVVNISATSPNHINAMDMEQGYGDGENPVVLKSEFLLSLCEQLMGSRQLSAKEKSIIDRCTAQCYHGYIRGGYQGSVPTLRDFHAELLRQPEPEARDVALAIELFTEGSLNTFAKPTNVDTSSRILCYDIRDLGKQLLPVGMLVVLDSVFNRIIRNRRLGRSTWVYIDEIYVRPEAA